MKRFSTEKLLVSPSMLAADFARLGEEVRSIDKGGAELVHLDVMDAHFVPNLTIGPAIVESLRKHTERFFDVHLMITEPLHYVEPFAKAGADHITFHIEAESDVRQTIRAIHDAGMTAGLTLKPGTPAETLFPYLKEVEMVLIMTVEPGFGGQKFMADQLVKAKLIREELKRIGHTCHIEADGGIGSGNVQAVAEAGINVVVAGTSVFRHKDGAAAAIAELHAAEQYLPK